MLILAIDTTGRTGGFALVRDGEVVASRTVEAERGLESLLFDEIAALLAEAGTALDAVDGFVALSGPGSFTGIRVGVSACKALGEARGKPVLGVSNLEALAYAGEGPVRAATLPGRRGDVFGAVFDAELHALLAERVEPAEAFFEKAGAMGARFVTSDAGMVLPAGADAIVVTPLAEAAGKLAWRRLAGGAEGRPEAADANYVERPAVEKRS